MSLLAVSDIFPPGSPSPCKAGRKTASDFSRNDTAEPCPGQEERSSDMIRRSLSASLHHDSFAGLQRSFNPNIALLLPRGQRLDDLPKALPCAGGLEKEERRASGRLAAFCLAGFVLTSPHTGSHHHPLHHGHPSTQLIPASSGRSDSHPVGIEEHIILKRKKTKNFTMLHIRWH